MKINQYYLAFRAVPEKKDGLQRVKISTEFSECVRSAKENHRR